MRSLTPLLNVANVPRSLDFYTETLGFRMEQQYESEGEVVWARITNGEATLMLNRSPASKGREPVASGRSYEGAMLFFGVEDAGQLHAQLSRAGLAPGQLEAQDYGVDEFTLRDPDGYELAFTSPRECA